MNNAGVCWIIRRAVFYVYICLNHGNHSNSYVPNKRGVVGWSKIFVKFNKRRGVKINGGRDGGNGGG